MAILLKAERIKKSFNGEEVLKGIDIEFSDNTFSVILGQSGSGKTTLLNILSGLSAPSAGRVIVGGEAIYEIPDRRLAKIKRREIGYVFQNYLLLANLTAEENIRIGAEGADDKLDLKRLAELLDIADILHKFPSELSGGQQQRVAIARAVVKKPKLLFCDEATGALDESNSVQVVELLHAVKKTFGVAVIFITHNPAIAQTADRIITMKNGLIVSDEANASPVSAREMAW